MNLTFLIIIIVFIIFSIGILAILLITMKDYKTVMNTLESSIKNKALLQLQLKKINSNPEEYFDTAKKQCDELVSLGFQKSGIYEDPWCSGCVLSGFHHSEHKIFAAVYLRSEDDVWSELAGHFNDGSYVVLTNSGTIDGSENFPDKINFRALPNVSVTELWQRLMQFIDENDLQCFEMTSFTSEYEALHSLLTAWRRESAAGRQTAEL
ncbi:hypothetical protein JW979_12930 [bacterium]|nr:hypothetical protein [candidate division CSSED10-310 bacterium]